MYSLYALTIYSHYRAPFLSYLPVKFRFNYRTKIQGNPDKTMKYLIFAFFLVPSFLFAQASPAIDIISDALGSGDVETLSKYFSDNVEISINEKEQNYPKARAAEAMRTFFSANRPKKFTSRHKGTSRGNGDQYCIGNFEASTGVYRVYLYLKITGSNALLEEIKFDKE